jgi:molybdopterin/thiamine biosynthesis adenylyltransferase
MYEPSPEYLLRRPLKEDSVYPEFFKLSDAVQRKKFQLLLQQEPIFRYDKIVDQVKELIKIRHPEKKLTNEELLLLTEKEFDGQTLEEYGVWVYYPWSKRLVHLLNEPEFIEVRTNRNLYKITLKEREILSKKTVGVIGLSVGQSVAMTMAMERSFGEIRIADFDTLDLSNLNRIRSGTHNLGIPKVIMTAREIAETDPFLKVVCFHEGITEKNIDSFMLDGGKLDVVIDECDNFNIKILCREKAKDLGIPVLMEASDRGTIDIERYDLEPNRPIFHGKLDMTYDQMKVLTIEEKRPYIYTITGTVTLSQRMKDSLPELGKTISAWPQLASAVVLGGGIAADIYRKICLQQLKISGRFFIDLDELIADTSEN